MLVSCAWRALNQIFSPPFRSVLWKSLALTVVLLAIVWLAITRFFSWWLSGVTAVENHPAIETYAVLLAGVGLVVGLGYLIPAVSMLVASFFLDDVAEKVERTDYPADEPGRALPTGTALAEAAKFALTMLGVNLIALLFVFIPGVNLAAFFIANAYLLGREYFALAAGRFRPLPEVAELRRRHPGTILAAGVLIAAFVVVPVLNLLTPLFGTALMVHLHKQLTTRALPVPRS
jgi:CysZ protein